MLGREATVDEVNGAFQRAAGADAWQGILAFSDEAIVSSDIVGNSHSCIVDGLSTMAFGRMVKVIGWYDNEWGYSSRLSDFVEQVAQSVTAAPVGAQA